MSMQENSFRKQNILLIILFFISFDRFFKYILVGSRYIGIDTWVWYSTKTLFNSRIRIRIIAWTKDSPSQTKNYN